MVITVVSNDVTQSRFLSSTKSAYFSVFVRIPSAASTGKSLPKVVSVEKSEARVNIYEANDLKTTHSRQHSLRQAKHRVWCRTPPCRISVWSVRRFWRYICWRLERSSAVRVSWRTSLAVFSQASICQLVHDSEKSLLARNFTFSHHLRHNVALDVENKLSLFFTYTLMILSHWENRTAP